jgi:thiamine transport system substrate-binding protein
MIKNLTTLIFFLSTTTLCFGDTNVLKVYTYDSFISEWGPGPAIEKSFEETCQCDLQLIGAGDGAALLARVQLEGKQTEADVVLGLDTNLTARAKETGLFTKHNKILNLNLPISWNDDTFIPFDWGYFSFVYNSEKVTSAPKNFIELAERSDLKIVIQDPRSSTPGLGLLMWVKAAYGDEASKVWKGLAPNILTVTKGWSEAYGLFMDGEAELVLSYTTSPAYHIIAENDLSKKAAIFEEGHYMQIEVAGKVLGTDQSDLADEFLEFMISDTFQSIIPTTNWMYPVIDLKSNLDKAFLSPVSKNKSLIFDANTAQEVRDSALSEWLEILSK